MSEIRELNASCRSDIDAPTVGFLLHDAATLLERSRWMEHRLLDTVIEVKTNLHASLGGAGEEERERGHG